MSLCFTEHLTNVCVRACARVRVRVCVCVIVLAVKAYPVLSEVDCDDVR